MQAPSPSHRWRSPEEPCRNCGDPTPGRYCPACGQRKTTIQVSVRELFADVVQDELVLNRSLPRTVLALLFRPGFLTREYLRGRVVRYVPPLRLYLVTSVLFFLVLSFVWLRQLEGVAAAVDALPEAVAAAAAATGDTRDSAGVQADTGIRPDTAAPAALAPGEPRPLPPGTMQVWTRRLEAIDGPRWLVTARDRKLAQIGHLPPGLAIRSLVEDYMRFAPHMVFLLLPVFAGLLKLLYIRRGRFYAEHFLFALHVHAFVFAVFILLFASPWPLAHQLLVLWMLAYVWLAMKSVYGQGFVRTTVKWWLLGWCYAWVFTLGMVGLAVITLLT